MRSTKRLLACVAACSVVVAVCGSGSIASASNRPTTRAKATADAYKTLNISMPTLATPILLAPQIAQAEGFFAKQGLDVTFVTVTSGAANIGGLGGGSLEVAPLALTQATSSVQKGLDLSAIAAESDKYTEVLLAPTGSPLARGVSLPWNRRLRALKGKTIGVQGGRQSSIWPFFAAVLQKAGLNPNTDVTVVNVNFGGSQLAALATHQVDVTLSDTTTQDSAVEQKIGFKYFNLVTDPPPAYRGLLIGAYFSRPAFLKAHPNFGVRFNAAIEKAFRFIANPKNADEVKRVAVDDLRLPDSPQLLGLVKAESNGLTASYSRADLNRSFQFLIASGQIPAKPVISLPAFYYPSIVKS
jgi:ABC-type nitrate/sulfonate/bicarbonate transport system substrate-binding protein